jgi:flavin reductase (DIM6/NTAB) family NADH-FMN oxidoreductase RutF
MKQVITDLRTFQYFYPYTVAVVGARVKERVNYMSCAWHTALSFDPPLFGILVARKRCTYDFISEAREFTVNFLAQEDVDLSAQMGRVSGHDRNKVEEYKVGLSPAVHIQTPVLDTSYAAFECSLRDIYACGDHEMFVGEVKAVQVREGCFDGKGMLDPSRIKPLLYLGSDFYITVDPDTLEHKLP